ncbi:MAG: hypothetical protein MJE68_08200, partial [Proteobacteria bacterium]|nr:hypothetical protein [Pseudomonadota bacterium]
MLLEVQPTTFTAQWTLYSGFRIKEGAAFTTVSMSNHYCHIHHMNCPIVLLLTLLPLPLPSL